ncbi:hypothetical protein [Pseudarthrobacter sp. ATCC 49987]|uniref:hypothetical protein n=1 Tax=Pseudarthrobacter sp. ATCC 49987 TaxID=2698204 RepID=UPI00136FA69D|nr:hypothetical protein [Pseudarthrobacter sp. ATCC 49987]
MALPPFADGPAGATPITAAVLNDFRTDIAAALTVPDAALAARLNDTGSQARAAVVSFVVPATAKGAANGVPTLDGTTKIPAAQLPDQSASYAPLTLAGAYAARPAFGTVKAGTVFYATDTLETYRAAGTPGAAATAWVVVGPGGNDLAYAESLTSVDIVSQTAADIPGLTITFTPGERPVWIEFGALVNIKGTPGEVVFRIMDGATVVKEIHAESAKTSYYTEAGGKVRKSYPAGVAKTLKVVGLQTIEPVVTTVAGASTWPQWLKATTA